MLTTRCAVPYLSAVEPRTSGTRAFDLSGTLTRSTENVHEATNGKLLKTNIRRPAVTPANPVLPLRSVGEKGSTRAAASPGLIRGKIVHGAARGRALGFPTANLSRDAVGHVPAAGIYAGWLTDEAGVRWPAAISAGFNPTFNGRTRHIEAHVIDRPREAVEDFDLYGQTVVLEFVERLRGMISFPDARALVEKMQSDVELARTILTDAEP